MESLWIGHGPSMEPTVSCPWAAHRQSMANPWIAHGQFMGWPWAIHGLDSPRSIRFVRGQSMDSPWTVREVAMAN
eukprot:2087980-Lingulodinium_polyedra.AAC.1